METNETKLRDIIELMDEIRGEVMDLVMDRNDESKDDFYSIVIIDNLLTQISNRYDMKVDAKELNSMRIQRDFYKKRYEELLCKSNNSKVEDQ